MREFRPRRPSLGVGPQRRDRQRRRQHGEAEQRNRRDTQDGEGPHLEHRRNVRDQKGAETDHGGEPGHQDGQAHVSQTMERGAGRVARSRRLLLVARHHVDPVRAPDRGQHGSQQRGQHGEGALEMGHRSEGPERREQDDRHGQEHGSPGSEDQPQASRHHAEGERDQDPHVPQHQPIDANLDVGATGHVEANLGGRLGVENRPDSLVHPRVDELLVRHLAEGHVDRGGPAVLRDQDLLVEGIGQGAPPEGLELAGIGGNLIEEARHLDPVVAGVVAEGDDVAQALDLPDLGKPRDPVGHAPEPRQRLGPEDLLRLHGDHEDLVVPEIPNRLAIDLLRRISRWQQGLRGGIDVEIEPRGIPPDQRGEGQEAEPAMASRITRGKRTTHTGRQATAAKAAAKATATTRANWEDLRLRLNPARSPRRPRPSVRGNLEGGKGSRHIPSGVALSGRGAAW